MKQKVSQTHKNKAPLEMRSTKLTYFTTTEGNSLKIQIVPFSLQLADRETSGVCAHFLGEA